MFLWVPGHGAPMVATPGMYVQWVPTSLACMYNGFLPPWHVCTMVPTSLACMHNGLSDQFYLSVMQKKQIQKMTFFV